MSQSKDQQQISLDTNFAKGVIESKKISTNSTLQVLYFEEVARRDQTQNVKFSVALSDGICYYRTAFCNEAVKKIKESQLSRYDIIKVTNYMISKLKNQNKTLVMVTNFDIVLAGVKKIIGKPVYIEDYKQAGQQNPFGFNSISTAKLFEQPKSTDISNQLYSQYLKGTIDITQSMRLDETITPKKMGSQSQQSSDNSSTKRKKKKISRQNKEGPKRRISDEYSKGFDSNSKILKDLNLKQESGQKQQKLQQQREQQKQTSSQNAQSVDKQQSQPSQSNTTFQELRDFNDNDLSRRFPNISPIAHKHIQDQSIDPLQIPSQKESIGQKPIQQFTLNQQSDKITEKDAKIEEGDTSRATSKYNTPNNKKKDEMKAETPKASIGSIFPDPLKLFFTSKEIQGLNPKKQTQPVKKSDPLPTIDPDPYSSKKRSNNDYKYFERDMSLPQDFFFEKAKTLPGQEEDGEGAENHSQIYLDEDIIPASKEDDEKKDKKSSKKNKNQRGDDEDEDNPYKDVKSSKKHIERKKKYSDAIDIRQIIDPNIKVTENKDKKRKYDSGFSSFYDEEMRKNTGPDTQVTDPRRQIKPDLGDKSKSKQKSEKKEDAPTHHNYHRQSDQQQPTKRQSSLPQQASPLTHPNLQQQPLKEPQRRVIMNSLPISGTSRSVPNSQVVEYLPISALQYINDGWIIKARVTVKSPIRTFKAKTGNKTKMFSIDLVDKEKSEIEATFFGDACDLNFNRIFEGSCYYLAGGMVKKPVTKLTNQTSDLQIVFDVMADVTECKDDPKIPRYIFKFVKISELNNCVVGDMVDVLAWVLTDEGETGITLKSGNTSQKRVLTLYDQTKTFIDVTFWGDQTEFKVKEGDMVIVKNAKVNQYMGKKGLVSFFKTHIITTDFPDSTEVSLFQDLAKLKEFQVDTVKRERRLQEPSIKKAIREFEVLEETNDQQQKYFYDINITIEHIQSDVMSTLYYLACPSTSCGRKVVEVEPDKYRCANCLKDTREPLVRYTFMVLVSDYTGKLWVNVFNKIGDTLLGCSAGEVKVLRESKRRQDEIDFQNIIKQSLLKEYKAKIMMKYETFRGKGSWRYNIMKLEPLSYKNESLDILEQLRSIKLAANEDKK